MSALVPSLALAFALALLASVPAAAGAGAPGGARSDSQRDAVREPRFLAEPVADERPGEDNPIQNPSRYTLFADDEVFLPASQNLHPVEVSLAPDNASLQKWTATPRDSPHCRNAARRFAHGRIVTPLRDQVVCASNYRVEVLEPFAAYDLPEAFLVVARPVSVAVGDLDRIVGEDGYFHDEIAVTYQLLGGRIRLQVLDWRLKPLASWQTAGPVYGDAAVAAADLDGDGKMELALALGNSDLRAYQPGGYGKYPGTLTLATFRYTWDGGARPPVLAKVDEKAQSANAAYASLDLRQGDFDGDGIDDLALASYLLKPTADPITIALWKTDLNLKLVAGGTVQAGRPRAGSYLSLAAGLLRFQPPEFTIQRRELALVWADSAGPVVARTYEVRDFKTITQRGSINLDSIAVADQIGPGIASGNFVGQQDVNSPRWQLAVQIPVPQGGDTFPRFVVLGVGNDLALSRLTTMDFATYASAGLVWAQELQAADRDGDSYFLGAPIHATIPQVLDTKYVIQEPPKHINCVPQEGADCLPVNVSASMSFYVELSDSQEQVVENTSRDTTSWDIGGSASATASETVSGGFGDIGRASVTSTQKVAVSYDYNEVTEKTNSVYKSSLVQRTDTTNNDDQLVFNVRLIDIWRYPVYGLDLTGTTQHGFYEVMLPGPITQVDSAASIHDWYQPTHQNKNVLSYPAIGPGFPADIGTFTPAGGKPVTGWLNEPIIRYWDGNQQLYSVDWTERAGKGTSKTYTSTLRETVDVSVGFEASVNAFFGSASGSLQFDFNFRNGNSWQENTVSNETLSSSNGIRLSKPGEGTPRQAYAFQTAAYVTEQGTFRVAHAANPLGASSGAAWWRETYGQAPNPAVNLPHRFTYSLQDFGWIVTPEPQRNYLRGLFLEKTELNPVTKTHDYLSNALAAGQKARLTARVYNFSLKPGDVTFDTLFEYAEVDPATDKVIGERKRIGTARAKLGPQGMAEVFVEWDTAGLGGSKPGAARYYRFFVTADPANAVPGEGDEADNHGFWPWNGGVAVFHPAEAERLRTANDLALVPASLRLHDHRGAEAAAGKLELGKPHRLQVTLRASRPERTFRHVLVYESDPAGGGRVVAARMARGVVAGDNPVWFDWTPKEAGRRRLHVVVLEDPDDTAPGNGLLALDVEVAAAGSRQVAAAEGAEP